MLGVFEMFHKQTSTDQGILLKKQLNTVKCLSFPEQNGLVFIMTGIQLLCSVQPKYIHNNS